MIAADETRESLSQRLTALRRPLPESLTAFRGTTVTDLDAQVVAGADGTPYVRSLRRRGHPRRRAAVVAAAATAVVALNTGAMYFAPVYADSLRHVPGLGRLLEASGMAPQDFTEVDVATEHDGVRVHVSAGYADENQTILVLEFSGPGSGHGGFNRMTLTDQFGRVYAATWGAWGARQDGTDGGGPVPGIATFAPISGAAATVGARLTLTMQDFMRSMPGSSHRTVVRGDWRVGFVLERHPALHLHLAAGGVTGATYVFDKATLTHGAGVAGTALVEIDWHVDGAAVRTAMAEDEAQYRASVAAGPGMHQPSTPPRDFIGPFVPTLLDARGNAVAATPVFGFSLGGDSTHIWGRLSYFLAPGSYRLVMHDASGGPDLVRELTIG